MLNSVKCR